MAMDSRAGQMAWVVLAVILALEPLAAQARPEAQSVDFSADAVMEHVRVLCRDIGVRRASTADARKAAEYIAQNLTDLGVTVHRRALGEVELPAVAVGPVRFFTASRRWFSDDNLWVEFQPASPSGQKALLIMAHYDTVAYSPGAADNAAAVGIALELARTLSVQAPARPVIVAFTAAEEQRLAGARALRTALSQDIGLAVSLDLIGAPGTLTINGASSLIGSAWLRYLARVAEGADVTIAAPVPHRVISRHLPQIERSDHGVFTRAGIPAVHLYTRPDGAVYLPYHTAFDTEARLDRASVLAAGRMVTGLARAGSAFPQPSGDQGIWLPGTTVTVPAWLLWLLALALIAAIGHTLLALGRARPGQRGPGLVLVMASYSASWIFTWLVLWLHGRLVAHPMPWVHAPAIDVLAAVLLSGACFAMLLTALARRYSPVGENRYLLAALAMYLAVGALLLIVRTPELACIPLAMAGLSSLLPRVRTGLALLVLYALALVPLTWPLDPDFLREAVYNGFFRREIPLALVLAVCVAPASFAAVYVVRRLSPMPYPRVRLCALIAVIVIAAAIILTREPSCTGQAFDAYNLTCELPGLGG